MIRNARRSDRAVLSMTEPQRQKSAPDRDMSADVVAFLVGRSVPCPRCGYDLRNAPVAVCPECAEPLVLKIGTPRARFGWLVLAMAPGCFSGVAACFVLIPIVGGIINGADFTRDVPWPIVIADAFGFMSAGAVVLMYRHRHRIMHWSARRQAFFAAGVWLVHVLMFVAMLVSMLVWFG